MSLSQVARRALTLAGWVTAGFAATLLLAIVGSLLLGERPVVVLSGSMEPSFSAGDVLIERGIEPRELQIGQIVTFDEPETERTITHRVRSIEAQGQKLVVTTKGDADNGVQRWAIDRDGELGRPAWRIPMVGHLAMLAKTPLGLLGLVLLPLLAVAGWEIYRIWRPREPGRLPSRAHGAST